MADLSRSWAFLSFSSFNMNSTESATEKQINKIIGILDQELCDHHIEEEVRNEIIGTVRRQVSEALASKSVLTPPELAHEWGVSPDKILGWIRSGELRASNLATTQSGRPRYRIDREAITEFKNKRVNHSPNDLRSNPRRDQARDHSTDRWKRSRNGFAKRRFSPSVDI